MSSSAQTKKELKMKVEDLENQLKVLEEQLQETMAEYQEYMSKMENFGDEMAEKERRLKMLEEENAKMKAGGAGLSPEDIEKLKARIKEEVEKELGEELNRERKLSRDRAERVSLLEAQIELMRKNGGGDGDLG